MSLQVLHSVQRWLPITQAWLWDQVRFLPPDVASSVVAGSIRNARRFPCRKVRAPWALPGPLRGYPPYRPARHRKVVAKALAARGSRGPGILHSHFGDQAWRDHDLALAARVPQVVTFYGHDVQRLPRDPLWRDRYADLFDAARLVLAEGPHMAATIEALGAPTVRVHPLGVDVQGLRARLPSGQSGLPLPPGARADGETDGPLRVLLVGGFREKKGMPDGIQAAAAAGTEVEVTIIGDSDLTPGSEEEKRRIRDALTDTGLAAGARLLGYTDHSRLASEIVRADVVVAPSRTAADGDCEGGAPVVLLEAMALGTAVIGTNHCDIPFVLAEGANGAIVPEGDVQRLAAALRGIRDDDEAAAKRIAAGWRDVATRFDARQQGHALAAIYREVAASPL